jgi:hypothetical protein
MVPALIPQQQAMQVGIANDAMNYILTRYPQFCLQSFFLMKQYADANSLLNRSAYIAQLTSWYETIIVYVGGIQGSIASAPDQSTLSAVSWDPSFSSFTSTDPLITLAGALAITN